MSSPVAVVAAEVQPDQFESQSVCQDLRGFCQNLANLTNTLCLKCIWIGSTAPEIL